MCALAGSKTLRAGVAAVEFAIVGPVFILEIGSTQPKSVQAKGFVNDLLVTLLRDAKLTALGIPLTW